MSALAVAQPYNEIFDGQKHYRTLVAMHRPPWDRSANSTT